MSLQIQSTVPLPVPPISLELSGELTHFAKLVKHNILHIPIGLVWKIFSFIGVSSALIGSDGADRPVRGGP